MQWRSRRGEARLYFPQLHFSHTPVPQILRWLTSCCSRPVYKLWQTLYVIMMHHFRFGKAATFWYFQSAHVKCRRDCPNFSTLDHYYVYYQRRSKQLTQHTVMHQKQHKHQQQHCTPPCIPIELQIYSTSVAYCRKKHTKATSEIKARPQPTVIQEIQRYWESWETQLPWGPNGK